MGRRSKLEIRPIRLFFSGFEVLIAIGMRGVRGA
jgi:hypothetical protein